jgi:hypothetical protein
MKIKRELIYFVSVLIFAFLCLKFPQNRNDKNSKIKTHQLPKEEMLSEETLKSIDSLNKSIDSLTIKNNTKIGPVTEVKIKKSFY